MSTEPDYDCVYLDRAESVQLIAYLINEYAISQSEIQKEQLKQNNEKLKEEENA